MLVKTKTKTIQKIFTSLTLMMFGFCFFVPNNLQAEEYIFNGNLDAANQDLWQLNQDINNKRSEIQALQKQMLFPFQIVVYPGSEFQFVRTLPFEYLI